MRNKERVIWSPNNNSDLSGEVKDGTVYVYEDDREKALETLRHEFLDYAVSQAIEPYRDFINMLIKLNEKTYRRNEKLVEALSSLFAQDELL